MASPNSRELNLDLIVTEFGATKMLRATSKQMPNLMVTGTDEADLWGCLGPVIESLFEAQGERVQVLTKDRSGGPRNLRVHLEVSPVT
jgi:hypothetical protein